jgi:Amt family ammonium transporter
LKRLAPYFATFSDFELSVYIEYYEDALTEQHANLILAVSGQVLACIGSLFFNSRYIATQSTIEEGISTFMANFVAGTCAALMIFVGQQLLRLMGNSDEISIYDPMNLLSCYMAGLVSISGCCNNVTFFSAAAIGCFGSVLFLVAKKLFIKIEIDDPINIVAVHLTCGIWALIAASLFDRD